jgi:hypothetical protein
MSRVFREVDALTDDLVPRQQYRNSESRVTGCRTNSSHNLNIVSRGADGVYFGEVFFPICLTRVKGVVILASNSRPLTSPITRGGNDEENDLHTFSTCNPDF